MSDLSGDASGDDTNTCSSRNLDTSSRSKGGRQLGLANKRKRIEAEKVTKAKNEITARVIEARIKRNKTTINE